MADRVWLGVIYIREGGGYQIILKALDHYEKRLRTIGGSPELRDSAAMFSSVLRQQAAKVIPEIDAVKRRIYDILGSSSSGGGGNDLTQIARLAEDVPFMEKALACYRADIQKAQDGGHEYFAKLVGDMESAKDDVAEIESASLNIKAFEPAD